MKLLISWSGLQSRLAAQALTHWIPDVLQDVETWMSDHDISAGKRWTSDLSKQLEDTHCGILCLTPDNLEAPWLLFEAGALSKSVDEARVIPYLIGVTPAEVGYPLAQFQGVTADSFVTLKLIRAVNEVRSQPMPLDRVDRAFDKWWPELERHLNDIRPHDARGRRLEERGPQDAVCLPHGSQKPEIPDETPAAVAELARATIGYAEYLLASNKRRAVIRLRDHLSMRLHVNGLDAVRVKLGNMARGCAALYSDDAAVRALAGILVDDLGWAEYLLGHADEARKNITAGIDIALRAASDKLPSEGVQFSLCAAKGKRHLGVITATSQQGCSKEYFAEASTILAGLDAALLPVKRDKAQLLFSEAFLAARRQGVHRSGIIGPEDPLGREELRGARALVDESLRTYEEIRDVDATAKALWLIERLLSAEGRDGEAVNVGMRLQTVLAESEWPSVQSIVTRQAPDTCVTSRVATGQS